MTAFDEATTRAKLPLVSIVTPSLNQGAFIRETIESVLAQTYPNIEYIVMDAGSTDETHAVAAEYEGRVCYISEPDRGQSHAINKGWRMANGDILSWLCADDVLLPGAVQAIVDEFIIHPSATFVFGRCEMVNRQGNHIGTTFAYRPDTWQLIHGFDYVPQAAAFARREAIEAVGLVDESLHFGMDWDLFIRLSLLGPVISIDQVLAKARRYAETKTSSGGLRRWRELVGIMRRHGEKRYPPAYVLYGAETLRDSLLRTNQPTPTWRSRIRNVVWPLLNSSFERVRIAALTKGVQGWFDDNWAGPSVTRHFYGGGEALVIRGRLPPASECPKLHGQRLTVLCNGRVLSGCDVVPGSFTLNLPIPADEVKGPIEIKLRAARSFVPKSSGMNGDIRRLAYYIDELAIQ